MAQTPKGRELYRAYINQYMGPVPCTFTLVYIKIYIMYIYNSKPQPCLVDISTLQDQTLQPFYLTPSCSHMKLGFKSKTFSLSRHGTMAMWRRSKMYAAHRDVYWRFFLAFLCDMWKVLLLSKCSDRDGVPTELDATRFPGRVSGNAEALHIGKQHQPRKKKTGSLTFHEILVVW